MGLLQVPAAQKDVEIVTAARNIMFSSAQKLQLTELSGRRDMSLLLAQSAVQGQPPSCCLAAAGPTAAADITAAAGAIAAAGATAAGPALFPGSGCACACFSRAVIRRG